MHLTLADAGTPSAAPARSDAGRSAAPSPAGPSSSAPSLGELERQHIADVLDRTGWHQGRAAELLGISPKTLYRKIREYGFKRPSGRNA
jgi:DNA-binding NtrC family response regulator